jgi:hypothetical protein
MFSTNSNYFNNSYLASVEAITQSNQEFPNCPKLLLSKHRQIVAYLDCQIKKKRIEKLV